MPALAQRTASTRASSARVANVQFAVAEEGRVSITYDLLGPETDRYWVKINLRLNEGDEFVALRGVTGDVGSVKPGVGRTATWVPLNQFPFGIDSNEAVFRVTSEVTARSQSNGSGVLPALLLLGALGGAAFFILN